MLTGVSHIFIIKNFPEGSLGVTPRSGCRDPHATPLPPCRRHAPGLPSGPDRRPGPCGSGRVGRNHRGSAGEMGRDAPELHRGRGLPRTGAGPDPSPGEVQRAGDRGGLVRAARPARDGDAEGTGRSPLLAPPVPPCRAPAGRRPPRRRDGAGLPELVGARGGAAGSRPSGPALAPPAARRPGAGRRLGLGRVRAPRRALGARRRQGAPERDRRTARVDRAARRRAPPDRG